MENLSWHEIVLRLWYKYKSYVYGTIIAALLLGCFCYACSLQGSQKVKCTVKTVHGERVIVETPNGEQYEFVQDLYKEGDEVIVTFSGVGSNDIQDDIILDIHK